MCVEFMLQKEQGDKQQLEKNNEVGKNIDASGKLLNTKWFQTIQDVTT